ncbi:hypothetical protein [Haploplasma axanthum]|uniref:Uncharacterized protein n=1 Tax=Haploplasma axanthum TaxID=29552 RepID=A0A449BFD3_HAPAX|nr:hypothetical protein [Haploplasma axanthum]VEU81138.1 Uncharacterised protein [Haploplasma axanthum]
MKEKDILKTIKKEIENNTPNVINKIDLKSIEIDKEVYVEKSRKKFRFNLISSISLVMVVLVFVIVLSFIFRGNNIISKEEKVVVTKKDQIVANYVVSGMNVTSNNQSSISKIVSDSEIDYFNKHLNIVLEYLELTTTNISIIKKHDNKQYDKYEFKMEVKVKDVFNKENEYTLYYNEDRTIEDDDDHEKKMEGILVYQSKEYNFKSEEEYDTDESEVKVIIYEKNYRNRIEIEKEIENDEAEYQYTIFENDNKVKEIKIEIEDEQIEITIDELKYQVVKKDLDTYNIINLDTDDVFELFIDREQKKYIYRTNGKEIVKTVNIML